MKIKKLTAYLLMSGMILGTMSSDLYTIKAQAVETIEETEDKTPENETPQVPETPEQPETEPENEEVPEAAPAGEIELSAEQFPDQVEPATKMEMEACRKQSAWKWKNWQCRMQELPI